MIVILEGSDGSGKTTLAKAIFGYCQDNLECTYLKSPAGRSTGSDELWGVWVKMALAKKADLIVMDRVPEISEAVYGFALDRVPRISKFLRVWATWPLVGTVPVFCTGRIPPKEETHLDPWGTDVQQRNYQIALAYNFLSYIFREEYPGYFEWDWHGLLTSREDLWHKFIDHLRRHASYSHYPFPKHEPLNFWISVEKGQSLGQH